MKLAVVGSRSIIVNNLNEYINKNVTEIVTGGAKGTDTCAINYATENSLRLTVFYPEFSRYGKVAPIKRNLSIAEYSDEALVFWDGKSKGTKHVISCFEKLQKKVTLIIVKK